MPSTTLFCSLLFSEYPAAVAAAYNPRLRGTAYAVARQFGDSHKNAVWSVSPQSLLRGVYPGMPVQALRKRFGDIAIIAYQEELHAAARVDLERVLSRYTPDVTVARHGVCFLDASRTPLARSGRLREEALEMQETVAACTGLGRPAVGMAASALVAKLLARGALPSGIGICRPGDEAEYLSRCETALLPGLSPSCRERLRKYGLKRVAQIQELTRRELIGRLGKEGERLYCMVSGIDMQVAAAAATIEAEAILDRDTSDRTLLLQHLRRAVDRFCHQVKCARRTARRARLTIRYTDGKIARKMVTFGGGVEEYLTVVQCMTRAFDALYVRRVGIKSILVTGNRLEEAGGQMELFETPWQAKQRNLGEKIAEVRNKLAFDAVFAGRDYEVVRDRSVIRHRIPESI